MSVESRSSLSPQQNRRLSNPLSDGETGLVNARSRLCFGFIKLVFVLEHLKTENIGRPSLVEWGKMSMVGQSRSLRILFYIARIKEPM